MKFSIKRAIAFTLIGLGIMGTFIEIAYSGDYQGDKKSLIAFTTKYSLKDWPVPETIDYYDPNGSGNKTLRYAHWIPSSQNRAGVVVHFNGRTEFIERNIYTYKDLLDRGFEVWAFDWRGQGFSRRQINEKQKHSIDTFDTYLSDASYFIENIAKIKQAKGKKVLLAHSMGGQIALRYVLEDKNKNTFDHVVLTSPLLRVPKDNWFVRLGNRIKTSTGFGKSCIFGEKEIWKSEFVNGESCLKAKEILVNKLIKFEESEKYSHDLTKMAEINCLVVSSQDSNGKESPDLRLACPTSDWLHATFDSTDSVMAKAKELSTPTLIVRAKPDKAVDNDAQDKFCALAKIDCKTIEKISDTQTGHELLIELQPIRKHFLTLFDDFIGIHK